MRGLADADGNRVEAIGHGEVMSLHVVLEATGNIREPGVAMWLTSQDGVRVFAAGAREDGTSLSISKPANASSSRSRRSTRSRPDATSLGCSVTRGTAGLDTLLFVARAADVVSYGADLHGLVRLEHTSALTRAKAPAKALQ